MGAYMREGLIHGNTVDNSSNRDIKEGGKKAYNYENDYHGTGSLHEWNAIN